MKKELALNNSLTTEQIDSIMETVKVSVDKGSFKKFLNSLGSGTKIRRKVKIGRSFLDPVEKYDLIRALKSHGLLVAK